MNLLKGKIKLIAYLNHANLTISHGNQPVNQQDNHEFRDYWYSLSGIQLHVVGAQRKTLHQTSSFRFAFFSSLPQPAECLEETILVFTCYTKMQPIRLLGRVHYSRELMIENISPQSVVSEGRQHGVLITFQLKKIHDSSSYTDLTAHITHLSNPKLLEFSQIKLGFHPNPAPVQKTSSADLMKQIPGNQMCM